MKRILKNLLRATAVLLAITLLIAYWCLRTWTDPEGVRRIVLETLAAEMPEVQAEVDEARLHWLGGVRLQNLRLRRRDQADQEPFLFAAQVTVYPDRERLSRGQLAVNKLELHQPTLRVTVDPEGRSNLEGLFRDSRRTRSLPIVVVRQGRVILDDQARKAVWHFERAEATLTPGSHESYHLHVTASSPLLGPAVVDGYLRLDPRECGLHVCLPTVAMGPDLRNFAVCYVPELADVSEVGGTANVEGELAFHAETSQPWSWSLSIKLSDGRLHHKELPVPLHQIQAEAAMFGRRLRLDYLTARLGTAALDVSGHLELSDHGDFDLRGTVSNLQVDEHLIAGLPSRLRDIVQEFDPRGTLDMRFTAVREGESTSLDCVLQPREMTATYEDFPYTVERIVGELHYRTAGNLPVIHVRLEGKADGQPVRLVGDVYGEGLRPGGGLRPGFNLEIQGTRVPITPRLIKALEPYPKTAEIVHEFKPTGFVTALVNLQRRPAEQPNERPPLDKRFKLRFHDATMCYAEFPYPVEEIEGTLEIQPDESWRFYDFRGRHKGGEFQASGVSEPSPDGNRIRLWIHGQNTLMDEELEAALDEEMKAAWKLFNPSGRADFLAQIDIVGKGRPVLELRAAARRCRMKPSCFPYQLEDVEGDFHYAEDRVILTDFRGRHGSTQISLKLAEVVLYCNGGYRADLYQLRADNLWVDQEFLDAVPPMVRSAFATLRPDKPIRIITDLVLIENQGTTQYHWDGSAAFARTKLQCGLEASDATGQVALRGWYDGSKIVAQGNLRLEEVTVAQLPLRDVRSPIRVTEEAVMLNGIEARLYGGQVYGPLRVTFNNEPRFDVDLTASQIDLETFARGTLGRSGQVRGKASARLRLQGQGSDLNTLRGEGTIHIHDGARIYDLPLILNLLTALSGHLPKGSAFQEARADLVIVGDRIRVTQAELLGDALSLRGQGDLRVDGTDLNLEMYGLLWGRTLPLFPPLIDRIPVEVSRQLMKIRIQGSLGDVQVKKEPMPILVEPLRELWKNMAERMREQEKRLRRRLP